MNPYKTLKVDYVTANYLGEEKYGQGAPNNRGMGAWVDVIGMKVTLNYPGTKLILCTISLGSVSDANIGFRFLDDYGVLLPIPEKTNNREPVHFSVEPPTKSVENQTSSTFHMTSYCKGFIKLQTRVDDTARFTTNSIENKRDNVYNHRSISVLTVVSLDI